MAERKTGFPGRGCSAVEPPSPPFCECREFLYFKCREFVLILLDSEPLLLGRYYREEGNSVSYLNPRLEAYSMNKSGGKRKMFITGKSG